MVRRSVAAIMEYGAPAMSSNAAQLAGLDAGRHAVRLRAEAQPMNS